MKKLLRAYVEHILLIGTALTIAYLISRIA